MRATRLLNEGVDQLRERLPRAWSISLSASVTPLTDYGVDALLTIAANNQRSPTLGVAVKTSVEPRNVPILADTQHLSEIPLLLIAPWISPRTRDRLDANQISYLDLTGNTHLQLSRPAVYVETTGATHNPNPPAHREVSLRGAAAGRLTRLLVDVTPPYTPSDVANGLAPSEEAADVIAQHSGVSLPHVSRLLTQLDREALVDRGPRGRVTDVDWPALLRLRAESYDLFTTHTVHGYIAPQGARTALRHLAATTDPTYRAITGTFAAATIHQPTAAPTQLIAYVDDPTHTAATLDLLPADENADVLLLTDFDYATVDRIELHDGLKTVATSQIALDCLSGNGRLPAEGEALIEWMTPREHLWRRRDLTGLGLRAQVYP